MKHSRTCSFLLLIIFIISLFIVPSLTAMPPVDKRVAEEGGISEKDSTSLLSKSIDQPNPLDTRRVKKRRELLRTSLTGGEGEDALALTGTDRVLVLLVEFTGTDFFTYTPGSSTWDPYGIADPSEFAGSQGDCSLIDIKYGLTEPAVFEYSGPIHNQIERPLSADDASGTMIWTQNFSPRYYKKVIFKNGTVFDFARQDGSRVYRDFTGKSVNNYFQDMSGGKYGIFGDIVGWLQVNHSIWWYGADPCPGAHSGTWTEQSGAIPGAGNDQSLVIDTLEAVKTAYPSFDWAQYDNDGDGVIDRLWIIHAGFGEEDKADLLNRTDYGESALWSHSAAVTPFYEVAPGIKAGPYIMMPENAGIGILAHEAGHNIGADDLYAYGPGDASAGFWSVMADDWTSDPIGFQPPSFDPWHLENLGWLGPYKVITDPTRIYTVTLGQASYFPGGVGVKRAVKIKLPDRNETLPVQPYQGSYQWWGGMENMLNARMTMATPVSIPPSGAALTFRTAYEIEAGWDFLWVQASNDGGTTWDSLANGNTTNVHAPDWIGDMYELDGQSGFSGTSSGYPSYTTESFSLDAYANQYILLRFWYMTDWSNLGDGPYIDDITVTSGATLFSDDAEAGDAAWIYEDNWALNDGTRVVTHNYYLQWRNVKKSGGYDSALGDRRWRYGPANSGLLVWYNSNQYPDNEIYQYLSNDYNFGPKGRMLVVDSHPGPYRDPYWLANGYPNEAANVSHRSNMRDAPFSLKRTVKFTMQPPYTCYSTLFTSRAPVGLFTDSIGYYPGAEYDSSRDLWATRQWDAGVVLPATDSYGINAPGYTGSLPFAFKLARGSGGDLTGLWFDTGLGYNGSTGNPGENGRQYGWNVKILSQTRKMAAVKIWNSRQSPEVILGSPNDREAVPSGSVYTISWGAPSHATRFNLFYSLNDGKTWIPIAEYVGGRSFNWTVPVPDGLKKKKCLIKVAAFDDAGRKVGKDRNGKPFIINVLKLTSPNERQTLKSGESHFITWETDETILPVSTTELHYTGNGGITWKLITTLSGNPGFHEWTVPDVNALKKRCKIRVVLKESGGDVLAGDRSDRYFRIKP